MEDKILNECTELGNYSKYHEYSKSNFLISSMSKSSLLENQIMAISLNKIFNGAWAEDERTRNLVVKIKAEEMKRLLHGNSGSFYAKLSSAARHSVGNFTGWENPDTKVFDYTSIIVRMRYENGILEIRYGSEIKEYLTNLKANFTILNLSTMLKFKNAYSFRLYELLKSRAYYKKSDNREVPICISYSIAKLKLELGVVDINDPVVKKIIDKSPKVPDYDFAVEQYEEVQKKKAVRARKLLAQDLTDCDEAVREKMLNTEQRKYWPSYSDWKTLRRHLLIPIIAEINNVARDIHIDYEPQKAGVGAKVVGINFYVDLQDKKKVEISDSEKMAVLEEMEDIIEDRLKLKDLKAIAEAADYDIDRIRKAYNVMQQSTREISSVTGFLISAIENEYDTAENIVEPVTKKALTKKRVTKNSFNNFEQSKYDFDKLEKDILSN